MTGFITAFYYSPLNYNQTETAQSMTVWDSLPSSLDYECLLFQCDWLGSNLGIGHLRISKNEWQTKNHFRANSRMSLSLMLRPTVSRSSNKAPIWGLRPDFYYRQKIAGLFMWGAISDERMGLSFSNAFDPRQHSHSRVRVPWDSWPYFAVSDLMNSRINYVSPFITSRRT
jgi:hypothetical protein